MGRGTTNGRMETGSRIGRRSYLKVTAGVSVAGLAGLAGCGSQETTNLTYAGSEQGSANFQAALPWSEQVGQQASPPVEVNVQTTGGLDANVRGVSSGEFDMGATTTPNFQAAALGVRPFQEEHSGLHALFTNMVYPFPIAFARTGSGIDYIEDLENSSVSTGPPGSAAHTYFTIYCQINGIDLDSMEVRRLGAEDAYRQLREGQLDSVLTGSVNTVLGPTTQEYLQRDEQAKLIVPAAQERLERLQRGGEILGLGYAEGGVMFDFPLETFQHAHQNSAVADQDSYRTVAGTNTLFTTLDVSDDVARELTRVAIESSDELADATALWAGFAEDTDYYATALPVLDSEAAPFHPGAVAAMEDADVWNDDLAAAER